MKEAILVSACLLGELCRYDGAAREDIRVTALETQYELIPVCPEVLGGLSTPRDRAERRGERVFTCLGADVTEAYRLGAEKVLRIAGAHGIRKAILKAKSPSCGKGLRYDGTFSGRLIPGDGVTAELLKANGVEVYSEETVDRIRNV